MVGHLALPADDARGAMRLLVVEFGANELTLRPVPGLHPRPLVPLWRELPLGVEDLSLALHRRDGGFERDFVGGWFGLLLIARGGPRHQPHRDDSNEDAPHGRS